METKQIIRYAVTNAENEATIGTKRLPVADRFAGTALRCADKSSSSMKGWINPHLPPVCHQAGDRPCGIPCSYF